MLYASLFSIYLTPWLVVEASFRQGLVHPDICETKECHDAADHIKKWMNPAFKPCEDFYEFTCGYWHSPDNTIVNKKHNMSLGSRGDFYAHHLKTFLLDESIEQESNVFQKMKHFLNLCLDEESIEASGVSPAVKFLREAGGWPVLEEHWSEEAWNLLDTEIAVDGVFLDIKCQQGPPDGTWSFMIIPKSHFDKSFRGNPGGLDNDSAKEYLKKMCDLAETFGGNRSEAEKEMRDALQFEVSMFELSKGLNKPRVIESYNMTQLQSDIPWINWTHRLTPLLPEGVTLAPNETIRVLHPYYVKTLGDLINITPNRTVANFMMYKAATSLKEYLPKKLFNITSESPDPRFDTCVKIMKSSSFLGILASYIARQTVEDTRVAKEMTQHILDELLIDLKQLEWLDEETRSEAIRTLQDTDLHISFPDDLLNMDIVEEYYKEVKVNTSSFFEALMDSNKWFRQQQFRNLGTASEDTNLQKLVKDAMSINAYFNPFENKIVITAGFLHLVPLFSSKVPSYVNYGHLGNIIAHELTHALDIQTDIPEGNMDVSKLQYLLYKWGSNITEETYNDKKQCIIDQYSSFNESKTTGIMLNGNQTEREDVADNGGLKLAFRAYKKMAAQLTIPEPKLPDLQQYSHEQLFLISLANAFCEIPDKETLLSLLEHDPHSPFEFRIKGMMMNLPDFSKLFSCNEGDPMNPQKKCEVWYLVSN